MGDRAIRLFFAFALPEAVLGAITHFREANGVLSVRWIPGENLHATVLFLGWTEEGRVPDVIRIARDCVPRIHSEPILSTHFDWAPPSPRRRSPRATEGGQVRMIWLYGEQSAAWTGAKQALRDALSAAGLYKKSDEREFNSHVTIARFDPRPRRELSDIKTSFSREWTPTELLLMQSVLSPRGPEYRVVERFPFRT